MLSRTLPEAAIMCTSVVGGGGGGGGGRVKR